MKHRFQLRELSKFFQPDALSQLTLMIQSNKISRFQLKLIARLLYVATLQTDNNPIESPFRNNMQIDFNNNIHFNFDFIDSIQKNGSVSKDLESMQHPFLKNDNQTSIHPNIFQMNQFIVSLSEDTTLFINNGLIKLKQNEESFINNSTNHLQNFNQNNTEIININEINNNQIKYTPSDCHHFIRTLNDIPSRKITQEIRNMILQSLQDNEFKKLSPLHIKELQKETKLSRTQLYTQIWNLRDKMGKVSKNGKKFLKQWIFENNNQSPNTEERNELQKKLGWSRRQLNQQIQLLRDEYSLESDNNININALDSNNSKSTIRILERKISKILPWQRDIIKNFVRSHSDNILSNHIIDLQNQTSLTKKQIYNQLRVLKERKGELTNEKKLFIKNWYFKNNHLPESYNEWQYLQNATNLNKTQLYEQFRIIRDKGSKVSRDQRQMVLIWLEENNWKYPSKDERIILIERSKLTSLQLKSMLQRLFKKRSI